MLLKRWNVQNQCFLAVRKCQKVLDERYLIQRKRWKIRKECFFVGLKQRKVREECFLGRQWFSYATTPVDLVGAQSCCVPLEGAILLASRTPLPSVAAEPR